MEIRKFGIGIALIFLYFAATFLFIPTTVLLHLGKRSGLNRRLAQPLVLSRKEALEHRNIIAKAIAEGAEVIFDHNEIYSMPVSVHFIKNNALKSVDEMESQLSAGEFTAGLFISAIGVVTTGIALTFPSINNTYLLFDNPTSLVLSTLSLSTAATGIVIVSLASIRNQVVDLLAYNVGDFASGTHRELMVKMTWNDMVAKKPHKMLHVYYLVRFAKLGGDQLYRITLTILKEAMDPEQSKSDVWIEFGPEISAWAFGDEVDESKLLSIE